MIVCYFSGAQKCNRQVSGYEHFRDGRCVLFDEAEFTRQAALWDAQFERCAGLFPMNEHGTAGWLSGMQRSAVQRSHRRACMYWARAAYGPALLLCTSNHNMCGTLRKACPVTPSAARLHAYLSSLLDSVCMRTLPVQPCADACRAGWYCCPSGLSCT